MFMYLLYWKFHENLRCLELMNGPKTTLYIILMSCLPCYGSLHIWIFLRFYLNILIVCMIFLFIMYLHKYLDTNHYILMCSYCKRLFHFFHPFLDFAKKKSKNSLLYKYLYVSSFLVFQHFSFID